MKLAYKEGNKIIIRNYKSIPKIGVLSFGDIIDWKLLNESNYFEVSEDHICDPIMQYLGAYEIVENKAIRTVIDKQFGTLAEEKAKKIKEIKLQCFNKLEETKWYIERLVDPTSLKEIPQNILDERQLHRDECNRKEAEILDIYEGTELSSIKKVLEYEL